MSVEIRIDSKRGCGWRKPGGLYLVSDGLAKECFRLPVPLTVCPTCHGGIKFTRGFTWIDADTLIGKESCQPQDPEYCAQCPFAQAIGRAGLLWVGEKFYKTPADFTLEAMRQGVSRRISAVPHDFKVGETWILLAHLKAITIPCPETDHVNGVQGEGFVMSGTHTQECSCKGTGKAYQAGIFHAFKPTAIEYVVKGDESEEELTAMVKRGITPIDVVRSEGGLLDDEQASTQLAM